MQKFHIRKNKNKYQIVKVSLGGFGVTERGRESNVLASPPPLIEKRSNEFDYSR